MNLFKLITQNPKPKEICIGLLNIEKNGCADFFDGLRLVATMERTRIDFAGSYGIMLSGFECTGQDKTGRPKYRLQEWWLVYQTTAPAPGDGKGGAS